MKSLTEIISKRLDYIHYLSKKRFVSSYKLNPSNYINGELVISCKYQEALDEIAIYNSLYIKQESSINTSITKIHL